MAKKTYYIDRTKPLEAQLCPKRESEEHQDFSSAPRSSALIGASKEDAEINWTVSRLVKHGYSVAFIARYTGLTHSQVSYRIRTYGLTGQIRAYRHGQTLAAITNCAKSLIVSKAVKDADFLELTAIRQSVLDAHKRGELR